MTASIDSNRKWRKDQGIRRLMVLLLAFTMPAIYACEETLSGDGFDLPYKKELILQGFLTLDAEWPDTITLYRTLPPLDDVTVADAAVTSGEVTITDETSGAVYQLRHVELGKYVADGLMPVAGQTYRIDASAEGLSLSGTARIPEPPEIITAGVDTTEDECDIYLVTGESSVERVTYDELNLYVRFLRKEDGLYSTASSLINNNFADDRPFVRFSRPRNGGDDPDEGRLNIYQECLDENFNNGFSYDSLVFVLYEYERDFRDYYRSRRDRGSLFFGPGGTQPKWNVTGDGFGYFFGRGAVRESIAIPKE